MSLRLTELELEISQRLQPLRTQLQSEQTLVRMLPETADQYGSYENKGVEVVFASSRSAAPEVANRQEVEVDIICRIVSPKRYTETPSLEKAVCEWMLDGCIDLLAGYRPKNAVKSIFFVGHNLQIPDDGRWTILATFRFTRLLVPAGDTSVTPLEPIIKKVIVTDNLGEISNVGQDV